MQHTPTKPTDLATHYRWSELPADRPMPLISRRRIIGDKVMLSEVRLDQGFVVPTHVHDNEQMVVVLSGRARFGIGAEHSADRYEIVVTGGEVLQLPSNVPHSAEALEDTHIIDVFSPPSEKTGVDQR